MLRLLACAVGLTALLCVTRDVTASKTHWDYIVVGAGPGGLQLAYYLHGKGRDYIVMEKGSMAGDFFNTYPRHDRLISINKRNTAHVNKEFNMRHDWNSLLSDDDSLQLRHYSKDYFPDRRVMVKYLNDFVDKLQLNVRYNTHIMNVSAISPEGDKRFTMRDQNGNVYTCKTLVMATGIFVANEPTFLGHEVTESYEDISLDPEDYEGKSVLILGRGNTAFEVADSIFERTNVVHIISRSRLRLSWETHYVGDLRAINNGLLDTYMLKSLDGIIELPLSFMNFTRNPATDKIKVEFKDGMPRIENWPLREEYDKVIRCLGWKFDDSVFNSDTAVRHPISRAQKYPLINPDFQSPDFPGLYFAGTNSHSLDFRKSSGGFIHGFRYTARSLAHILESAIEGNPWPSVRASIDQLVSHATKRINEASGIYQMFTYLGDVMIVDDDGQHFTYMEAYPLKLLHRLGEFSGLPNATRFFVMDFEYGKELWGPGNDIFTPDRATLDPTQSIESQQIHPMFYFFERLPTEEEMNNIKPGNALPQPTRLHAILEDLAINFDRPQSHLLPLRRFIETSLKQDLRHVFAEDCARDLMLHASAPAACLHYQEGQGLLGDSKAWSFIQKKGL